MGFMLVGLLVLQVFWTYYIGKAFVEVNVSAKIAENNYEWNYIDSFEFYLFIILCYKFTNNFEDNCYIIW